MMRRNNDEVNLAFSEELIRRAIVSNPRDINRAVHTGRCRSRMRGRLGAL
jgi:hypothetical protein